MPLALLVLHRGEGVENANAEDGADAGVPKSTAIAALLIAVSLDAAFAVLGVLLLGGLACGGPIQ